MWRIGAFPDEIWIARSFGAQIPGGAGAIPREDAGYRLDEWFPDDGAARRILVEILAALGLPTLPRPGLETAKLRASVRAALYDGSLAAFRVQAKLVGGGVQAEPPKPKDPEPPKPEQKTWIVVELVDDDDPPKPVPFKKYKVELPDGSTREGQLDQNGQARLDGIEPGTCKVSFPQFHGEDWAKA